MNVIQLDLFALSALMMTRSTGLAVQNFVAQEDIFFCFVFFIINK